MPRIRLLIILALAVLAGPVFAVAVAQGGGGGTSPTETVTDTTPTTPPDDDNPCTGDGADDLRCPDLIMAKPEDLYASRSGSRTRLHATNQIINVGEGPMELRGKRKRPLRAFRMSVKQAIRKRSGGYLLRQTDGELFFKVIPGQYRYWKFVDAGALEIWSLDSEGKPLRRVRKSPKKVYCLRDLLRRARPPSGSPRGRVYPGCNQDPDRRSVTLGTSVGWIDRYPATYHEQYVDVTGLKGPFAYVMIADPDNHLAESDETNNMAYTRVTLPVTRDGYLPGY